MESIVRIKEILPLESVQYQNKTNGQTEILRKKAFIVTHGDQVFMLEANGKLAESLDANQSIQVGTLCVVSVRIFTREYLTKENTRGFSTDLQLRSMNPI